MAAPRYTKDDIVYIAASADKGTIESFKVAAVSQRPDGLWYYTFFIAQRPPTKLGTIGDRITKKRSYNIELAESDLTSLDDALNRAEVYLKAQLAVVQAYKVKLGLS
jgi:hypothetical protein